MSKEKRNYILFRYSRKYGEVGYKWRPEHYTKKGLINRLAYSEVYGYSDRILNNLVDEMHETEEVRYRDLKRASIWSGRYTVEIPKYYIAKENGNVIKRVDASELIDLVNLKVEEIKARREIARIRSLARQRCETYKFRRGPVPGVHKPRWHRGCFYRHPLTTGVKRKNTYIDEDFTFTDTKIKYLPNVYDDLVRHTDKSWKTSCKVRKQWMKHVDKHIDTIKINKKTYITE